MSEAKTERPVWVVTLRLETVECGHARDVLMSIVEKASQHPGAKIEVNAYLQLVSKTVKA